MQLFIKKQEYRYLLEELIDCRFKMILNIKKDIDFIREIEYNAFM